jgi:hypothetical protein
MLKHLEESGRHRYFPEFPKEHIPLEILYHTNMGDMRNDYTILVGKQEGISPLGRPRHR